MSDFNFRPTTSEDAGWMRQFLIERWGSDRMVAHGVMYYPHTLPGFAAFEGDQVIGLITYHIEGEACEVVTIDSVQSGQGIGTRLIEAVCEAARPSGARRVWLITTNDNLNALRFYQRRGFVLAALRRDAVTEARRIKPEIPLVGDLGIPLRDEIELERRLD